MAKMQAFSEHICSGIPSEAIVLAASNMTAEVAASDSESKWKSYAGKLAQVCNVDADAGIAMAEAYRHAPSQQIFEN
jgi:predicted secreted protein